MAILSIALNTFRETVRDKVLYNILLFAVGFAVVSIIVSQWSLGQQDKILKDFGLTIVTVFSLVISIFIGTSLIYKEVEKRTVYSILSKPISRAEFVLGKYFGLALTMFISFIMMSAGLLLIIWLFTNGFHPKLLIQLGFIFLTMTIIIAIALLLSTFVSPIVSSILTLFVFIGGNFSADIRVLGVDPATEGTVIEWIINLGYYLMPNLQLLNFHTEVVHNMPLDINRIIVGLIYTVLYNGVIILLAVWIFNKKNIK
ncbi:ABC transporter permease [candidate division KSB1 bacterium]